MVKIFGNIVSGSPIGISVPNEDGIEVSDNVVTNCRKAIEVRNSLMLRDSLGIAAGAEAARVREVVKQVLREGAVERGKQAAADARAQDVLAAGANITTLVSGLFQLRQAGLVDALMQLLK